MHPVSKNDVPVPVPVPEPMFAGNIGNLVGDLVKLDHSCNLYFYM